MFLLLLLSCDPRAAALRTVLTPDDDAPLKVWLYRSPDGNHWQRDPSPVAWHFSSLGIGADAGTLVGLPAGAPTAWEERFPSLFVAVLESRDLRGWSVRRASVDAPGTALIDPSLVTIQGREELWFVRAEGVGDPAGGNRATELVRTRGVGAGFGEAETWYVGRGLVDVAPVWFAGELRVFATRNHGEVVMISGTPPRETLVAGGITVPQPVDAGEELWLLAQAPSSGGGGHGGMRPVRLRSRDGRTFGAAEVLDLAPVSSRCASPVAGRAGEGWVLYCVEEGVR